MMASTVLLLPLPAARLGLDRWSSQLCCRRCCCCCVVWGDVLDAPAGLSATVRGQSCTQAHAGRATQGCASTLNTTPECCALALYLWLLLCAWWRVDVGAIQKKHSRWHTSHAQRETLRADDPPAMPPHTCWRCDLCLACFHRCSSSRSCCSCSWGLLPRYCGDTQQQQHQQDCVKGGTLDTYTVVHDTSGNEGRSGSSEGVKCCPPRLLAEPQASADDGC